MTKRKRRPIGQTIGGIIVGFDQQVFRTTPPAQELVEHAKPVRGISGEDGSDFLIVMPGDVAPEATDDLPVPEPLRPDGADDPADPPRRDGA